MTNFALKLDYKSCLFGMLSSDIHMNFSILFCFLYFSNAMNSFTVSLVPASESRCVKGLLKTAENGGRCSLKCG